MDLCEDYGIPPFFCLVVKEYELPTADTVADSVKLITKRIATNIDKFVVHPIFGATGQAKNCILIQCEDRQSFAAAKQLVSGGVITLHGNNFPVSMVYDQACTPRKDHSPYRKVPLRKLKLFSGAEKVGGGEVDAREWLSQANDLIDNERELKEHEKMRILRNSLIKQALLLVSSSEVNTCKELLDLIALTYGEAHSAAHLRFKFYQMQQNSSESASLFLSRLQDTLKEYGRVDNSIHVCEPEIRFKVFTEGLKPDFYDLMNIHLGLERMLAEENFPDFPNLLRMVQSFERNRRERFERSHEVKCASINSIPLGKNLESSKSNTIDGDSAIKQELSELKKQMATLMSSKPSKKKQPPQQAACAEVSVETEQAPPQKQNRYKYRGRRPTNRCWNCGADGHTVYTCTKEWDATAVKTNVESVRQKIQAAKERRETQEVAPAEDQKN